jgi:hypothetical protein
MSTLVSNARNIMGDKMISALEAFRLLFPRAATPILRPAIVPWSTATLLECSNSHLLIESIPLKLAMLFSAHPDLLEGDSDEDRETFGFLGTGTGWQLVRIQELAACRGKEAPKQQEMLLAKREFILSAADAVFALLVFRMRFGMWPHMAMSRILRTTRTAEEEGFAFMRARSEGPLLVSEHGGPCWEFMIPASARIPDDDAPTV